MNAGIGIVYFVPVSPAALCPGPHDGSTGPVLPYPGWRDDSRLLEG